VQLQAANLTVAFVVRGRYDRSVVKYYFLKLGPGNSMAIDLLQMRRLGVPTAVGFFRNVSLADLHRSAGEKKVRFSRQAVDMYRWAQGELEGYAITVAAGWVWILEPTGPMYEMGGDEFDRLVAPLPRPDDSPFLVPVRILAEERLTHVPALLAQITSNRSLSSSTFKEIQDDFGNQVAIDHVAFKAGLADRYPAIGDGDRDLYHLLLCLGSNELIALIARLLEEHGLTVPAPTGGFVKNVDLFAYNDHPREIAIGDDEQGFLRVGPRRAFRYGAVAVQVRGAPRNTLPEVTPDVDYLVQLNATPAPQVCTYEWIRSVLNRSPWTRRWLERILRWVPFSGTVLADRSRG